MRLPFTATQPQPAECFVSLLLRPIVCPEVPGFTPEKTMEVRFFVPGNLVSNLDFVESIFGNGGDPNLPENDAGLDTEHWTGHTGCVILAPHLTKVTKKSAGLPHWDQATERQRRDGMCWKDEWEFYNNGQAFKLTCRDETGVIVTIIADNYYGYCKKEVKTQISFAANLFGACEEEHAGGALVFPATIWARNSAATSTSSRWGIRSRRCFRCCATPSMLMPEGFAVDKNYPGHHLRARGCAFDLHQQKISWPGGKSERPSNCCRARLMSDPPVTRSRWKSAGEPAWRLVGTVAEGTLCHKPCTVSGGGKSEISKPITDAILTGPVFVADFKKDFDQRRRIDRARLQRRVSRIRRAENRPAQNLERGTLARFGHQTAHSRRTRLQAGIQRLARQRAAIPQGTRLRSETLLQAGVGRELARPFQRGHHQRHAGQRIEMRQPQAGHDLFARRFRTDGLWRTFGLRKDFHPAMKIQVEDDITASVVVPAGRLENLSGRHGRRPSLKFVQNCEQRLFQRPDDAIHRGYDKQTESDFRSRTISFPITSRSRAKVAREMVEDAIGFYQFTAPMQALIREVRRAWRRRRYFVSTAQPAAGGRQAEQKSALPAKAPRPRPSARNAPRGNGRPPAPPRAAGPAAAHAGHRDFARPPQQSARGRHPLARGVQSDPLFELPELFMEFICSMTGKSPSTTGAGSEGALTKGPFNALPPIIDLNNALVSCHPHRPSRLRDRRRLRRPEGARGPRRQPARAGSFRAACRRRNATRNF